MTVGSLACIPGLTTFDFCLSINPGPIYHAVSICKLPLTNFVYMIELPPSKAFRSGFCLAAKSGTESPGVKIVSVGVGNKVIAIYYGRFDCSSSVRTALNSG